MVTTTIEREAGLVAHGSGMVALVAMAGLTAVPPPAAAGAGKGSRVEFNRDIRPILSDNCFSCHGPDKNQRKAKLRLDERASALATEAIVPGKPDESELVARIFSDDADEVMPPPSTHKTLTAAQKELLKQWIAAGGRVPAALGLHRRRAARRSRRSKHAAWVRNPIDAFILAHLEAEGITPVARGRPADA